MKYSCDCGRAFKTYRALGVHLDAGCPAELLELWLEGKELSELSASFPKTQARIRTLIRREGIRRMIKLPEEELP